MIKYEQIFNLKTESNYIMLCRFKYLYILQKKKKTTTNVVFLFPYNLTLKPAEFFKRNYLPSFYGTIHYYLCWSATV